MEELKRCPRCNMIAESNNTNTSARCTDEMCWFSFHWMPVGIWQTIPRTEFRSAPKCQVCGSEELIVKSRFVSEYVPLRFVVQCISCGSLGVEAATIDETLDRCR